MLVWGKGALPALMVAGLAATAGAQQKACDIDEGNPAQVARAMLDLNLAQSASKPEDAAKALKDAVKLLNEGDKTKNPVGRAMVYGKTLSLWMAQPTMANGMTTRGAIGFQTDTAAHSISSPASTPRSRSSRRRTPIARRRPAPYRQQKGWVDLVNHAIEFGNAAGKSDSAVYLAKRSLQLYKNAPYGYMVLAKASAEKNQPKEAINYYKQAIDAAAKDTSAAMQDNRRSVLHDDRQLRRRPVRRRDAAKTRRRTWPRRRRRSRRSPKDPGTKYADAARSGQARLAHAERRHDGDQGVVRRPAREPGRVLVRVADDGRRDGGASEPDQGRDQAVRGGARRESVSSRRAVQPVAPLPARQRVREGPAAARASWSTVDPSNPDNYQLLAIAYAAMKKDYDVQAQGRRGEGEGVRPAGEHVRRSAARHEGEHRLGGARSIRSSRPTRIRRSRDRLGAEVSGDHDEAAGEGRVHRVHADRREDDDRRQRDEPDRRGARASRSRSSSSTRRATSFRRRTSAVPVGRAACGRERSIATGTGAGIVAFRYPAIP